MKSKVSGINSLVLVLVAFSSLLSMFALTRIDQIVNQDLYRYGLRFSYEWAMPYWTMTTLVFTMGWFNIIVTGAFQFYVLLYGRKEAETTAQRETPKPEIIPQPSTEEKQAETVEAKTSETEASPMEVELETWREYEEAQRPEEEVEPRETEPQPEERYEEPQEPVDVQPQEETELEETSREITETETQEAYPTTQEAETEMQQKEDELTETYPT